MNRIKILIVEDERPISDLIKMILEDEGYECFTAYDGLSAADMLEDKNFDLVLLDIMLPKIDGYELFEYIKTINIPVIFLTAKSSINDRVKGLNLGAEDYIIKPFDVSELIARVNVVLRRFHKKEQLISFLDIIINLENSTATKNGKMLDLTPKEFELLCFLVKNKDIVLSHDAIYEAVWDTEYDGKTRTLELHIQRLRKKTGLDKHLKTLYRIGYCLNSNQ